MITTRNEIGNLQIACGATGSKRAIVHSYKLIPLDCYVLSPIDVSKMRAARLNQQLAVPAPKEIYNYQIFMLAIISSMGAVMFGYDLGFIGTALELESFQK